MKQTILIAAGGSGGHVLPAVTIGKELEKFGFDFVITGAGTEIEKVTGEGAKSRMIPALKPSANPLKFVKFYATYRKGLKQSYKIIDELHPVAVIGMGNFTTLPLVVTAKKRKLPVFLHEQNFIGGRANRFLAGLADVIMVAFDGTKGFPNKKMEVVGNPIRWPKIEPYSKEAYQFFGLDAGKKTVLIFGGSQGSKLINKSFLGISRQILENPDIQWILATGATSFSHSKLKLEDMNLKNVSLFEFIGDIDKAYSIANLVISRAGAMTVSELECYGIPSILVPRKLSINKHQDFNAKYLASKADCIVINEDNLASKLEVSIKSLIDKPRTPRECCHANSAVTIAQLVKEVLQ
jgi:UDP-N-acetylglucosamine--N-acetylmuramyl-(pentapeptide) pyrophosphoryl-undecaprenol N-acetylglucosamine transferase